MQILRILGISLILHFGLGGAVALAGPDGRALYLEHCSACHQFEGQGGIGLPLATKKLADVSDDYLRKSIRLGRPGRVMPAPMKPADWSPAPATTGVPTTSTSSGTVNSKRPGSIGSFTTTS